MTKTTINCPRPHCTATTTDPASWQTSDDEQLYCPDCIDYSMTDSGEVLCGAHDVPKIEWGPIQTPGFGSPNYQRGTDAEGRAWITEDRGGWTVPRPEEEL